MHTSGISLHGNLGLIWACHAPIISYFSDKKNVSVYKKLNTITSVTSLMELWNVDVFKFIKDTFSMFALFEYDFFAQNSKGKDCLNLLVK